MRSFPRRSLLCPNLLPVVQEHWNPWFKVMSRGGYYTLEYERPQVVILPVIENRDVVMVRVKRPVIADTPLELPAGDSLPGETEREAARRELAEETGVRIDNTRRFIADLPLSDMPDRIPMLLRIFRVDLSQDEFESRTSHDDEIASVESIPFRTAALKIIQGEIYVSSAMAVVARLLLKHGLTAIAHEERL